VLAGDRPGCYRILGEADIAARDGLRAALAAAAAAATGDLWLDLAGLTFIDVGGTAELVAAALRLHRDGRQLVLHGAAPMLCRIIDLAWGQPPGLQVHRR
jgi:anti-anti-sigma factor